MYGDDIDSLSEIKNNDNVYRYIPPFLYKKSRGNLFAAIRNLGGRDFEKRRMIVRRICLRSEPERVIGLAGIFDYKKRLNQVTIGYRINENYWHRGIATETVRLLVDYFSGDMAIKTLKAYVMSQNVYSQKAFLENGFLEETDIIHEHNRGGRETGSLNKCYRCSQFFRYILNVCESKYVEYVR